jgi:hypothetical protein
MVEEYQKRADFLLENMDDFKQFETKISELKSDPSYKPFNPRYVDREEDPDLKSAFEKHTKDVSDLQKAYKGKIDAEITLDISGNLIGKRLNEEGEEIGKETYVLRNGQLVKGKAEKREVASHSNWHCSNADPEDIRRHREMMDRMSYRGPQWEDQPVPKSVMEEMNPVYHKVDQEEHPSVQEAEGKKGAEFGKKDFEYVVR